MNSKNMIYKIHIPYFTFYVLILFLIKIDVNLKLIIGLVSLSFFSGMIVVVIISSKVKAYIKKTHYEKWCEITEAFGMPGGYNTLKMLSFVFGDELNDVDQNIPEMKKVMKHLFCFQIMVIIISCLILRSII